MNLNLKGIVKVIKGYHFVLNHDFEVLFVVSLEKQGKVVLFGEVFDLELHNSLLVYLLIFKINNKKQTK